MGTKSRGTVDMRFFSYVWPHIFTRNTKRTLGTMDGVAREVGNQVYRKDITDKIYKEVASWQQIKPEQLILHEGADGGLLRVFEVFITGKDKGKSGEVVSVFPKTSRVVIRGVNIAKRHTAQSQTSQGGILDKELSIHVSNVLHIDPKDKKATKIGYKFLKDGRKVRFAKRSGDLVD